MHKKNNAVRVVASLALIASSAALAAPKADTAQFNDFWTPAKPNAALCRSPLLVGTPVGLPRCMQASNVMKHLEALQDIATLNGGNRASGQPATRRLSTMCAAGYSALAIASRCRRFPSSPSIR